MLIDGDDGSDAIDPNADVSPVDGVDNDAGNDDANANTPTDQGDTGDVTDADLAQPKKRTAKDRIDELTADKYELRREIEYLRSRIDTPQQQAPAPQQQAPARPDPSSYELGEFDGRYIEDLSGWKASEIVGQKLDEIAQRSTASQAEAQWQSRVSKAAESLPDFEEKVLRSADRGEWPCSAVAAEAIRTSEKGPELAYHLATNPAEAARINRLPPTSQLMELGRLEAKLAAPKPKTATNAPAPTPQVRGSSGKFAAAPDTNDFAAFDAQYGNGS